MRTRTRFAFLAGCALLALSFAAQATDATDDQHQIGTKYSALKQITTGNVAQLQKAWEYHTGETPAGKVVDKLIAFEDQPSMIDGNLVVCTTSRRLIALDPASGAQRWVFDPQDAKVGTQKCRGITHWVDSKAAEGSLCKSRIFLGTADYRLVAIDGTSGKRCPAFGDNGQVKMETSMPQLFPGEVVATSNPGVVNDVVVVGSAVADNQRVNDPSGRVLAFDARTGAPRWQFDPLPRDAADPAMRSWAKGTTGFGGGNVWSSMAVDQERDLIYLPTTSSSSDFYGGDRAGNNNYTTSVVALKGATGQVVWHYQLVHHNIFDYDVPSQALLIDYPAPGGGMVPALVQNTKMGLIFVLNRVTGEPLVPIVETPAPQADKVDGEMPSPTQPIPQGMPTLTAQSFSPDDAWGFTPIDRWLCRRKIESFNYGPIYSPPSLKGTIFSPSVGGGSNWGGGAYDPESHIMVVPTNRVPTVVSLIPRAQANLGPTQKIEAGGPMMFPVTGSPYVPKIEPLLGPLGAPCSAPPWAALTAVDIVAKKIVWEVPLGSIEKMMPSYAPKSLMDTNLGTPGAGGPLVTAGGLVFIGYTLDNALRAFDLKTGKELWKADLPAAGTAMPVTYEAGGEQYIVIAAGGHTMYGATMGDSVVAYKLKR